MSKYYQAPRAYGLYDKKSKRPFKVSRSKIDLFLNCSRCFYYDLKLGVKQPPGYPFNLNNAVDTLLKKEFDASRTSDKVHPLLAKYGVDARPAKHRKLEEWRDPFKGVSVTHKPTNFLVYGGIDDLWQYNGGDYIVVDYKATSKDGKIEALNADWHKAYKRQLEIYQWLLRQNKLDVSDTAYWVYANAYQDREAFDGQLEFDVTLIAYDGKADWIDETLVAMKELLDTDEIPAFEDDCDHCTYVKALITVSKS